MASDEYDATRLTIHTIQKFRLAKYKHESLTWKHGNKC